MGGYADQVGVRAALFDIDGTLTTGGEVWGGLIHSPDVTRLSRVTLYAASLPHYALSKAGVVSQAGFRERWVGRMAGLMRGWSAEQVQAIYYRLAHDYLIPKLRPDTVEILRQHKASGHIVLLVTTMFTGIAAEVAAHVGADAGIGSPVEMRDGRCTGRLVDLPCAGARKIACASAYLEQHQPEITPSACAAYGDSRSDIAFLAGVGFPVAVYPDDAMRAAAQQHRWRIYEGRDA